MKSSKADLYSVSDELKLASDDEPLPYFQDACVQVAMQYRRSRGQIGEDGLQCRHLCLSRTKEPIGFITFVIGTEDQDERLNVQLVVDYVYLQPRIRGMGLTKYFRDMLVDLASVALQGAAEEARAGQEVVLTLIATVKSEGGEGFLATLYGQLQQMFAPEFVVENLVTN